MKPFIKYPGGKSKEYPIVDQCKPTNIRRYFEPFVGGASIYLNIHVRDSYINDKSKDLINLYKYVQVQDSVFFEYLDELDMVWRAIESGDVSAVDWINADNFNIYCDKSLQQKNRKFSLYEESGYVISSQDRNDVALTSRKTALYMCIRDVYNNHLTDNRLHTACFYFLREYCYSSMFRFNKYGEFNVPYGGRSYNFKYMTLKISQMKSIEVVKRFQETSIFNMDFEDFLNLFDFSSTDFVFLDPPYDSNFSTYDNNKFDKLEQVRLCNFLSKTKAKWMLIIKKTEFIADLYKDFYIHEYDKNYLVSFKNRNLKGTKHLLITNYSIEG